MIDKKKWMFIPKAKATTIPENGGFCQIYRKFWWALTDNDELIFTREYSSPQCNWSKEITERISAHKNHPGTHVAQLDAVFLSHNCKDYIS